VQGAHQQPYHPFPQRVSRDQFDELGDVLVVAALPQLQLQAVLHGGQPVLVEPGAAGLDDLAGHPGKRRTLPQRERVAQSGCGVGEITGRLQLLRGRHGRLEDLRVELAGVQVDAVAGAVGRDGVLPACGAGQLLAQARDAILQLASGGGRRGLVPYRVDQVVPANHPIGGQEQNGENPAVAPSEAL
jgi:hypothetical protein